MSFQRHRRQNMSRLRSFAAISGLFDTIGHNVFWMGIAGVGSRALLLAASIGISRLLGVDGFGRYGIIQATLGTLGTFAGAGLGMTVTKFVAQSNAADAQKTSQIISLVFLTGTATAGAISAFTFFVAPWLSTQILADPALEYPIRITSAQVFFDTLAGVQFAVLAGMQVFKVIAFGHIATAGTTILFSVVGAYLTGLVGACLGLTIGSVASCFLAGAILGPQLQERKIRLSFSGIWQHRYILPSFSLPALLSGLVVDPVNWICAALVVHQSGGYHQMGAFYAANQWLGALLFVPGLVAYVAFPRLAQAFAQEGRSHAWRVLALAVRFNAGVTIPLVLILSIDSAWIMALYSPVLASEWQLLDVVLITAVLVAIASTISQAIAASGRMWTGVALNALWAASYILLTLLLLKYGALGLATARAMAYGLQVICASACALWLGRGPQPVAGQQSPDVRVGT